MSTVDCIFCRIVSGQIPCYRIAETAEELAFLDINPIACGHMLVVSKSHVESLHLAPTEVVASMAGLAARLARAAVKGLQCDGVNLLLNSGPVAGQIIPHLHLHVIPRFVDDHVRIPWPHTPLDTQAAPRLIEAITAHFI